MIKKNYCHKQEPTRLTGRQILDSHPLCLFVTLTWSLAVRHIGALTPAERLESHYVHLHH